ncbi:iron complex outermembrane receptor protein [Paraburkholderia sp. 40]
MTSHHLQAVSRKRRGAGNHGWSCRKSVLLVGGVTTSVALFTPTMSFAAGDATDIGTVSASSAPNSLLTPPDPNDTQSAPYQAPTKTPLTAMQPTAVISKQYLDNNVAPSANYDTAIRIAPSVTSTEPNGPGLSEGKGLTIRGFQDGQFNVTFDGIPFGDGTNFAHNSAAWFMTNDLGQISVDRGPGTASTIGDATFGGTVSLLSKTPDSQFQVTPYGSAGSYNTFMGGLQVDSGRVQSLNGGSGFIDAEHINSDGAQSNASVRRTNVFGKWVQPIGNDTLLTFAAMYDNIRLHTPIGATKAQISKYGPSYAWSNDPTKQNYYGFNYDNLNNDFEYIGIDSNLGSGWSVHNKVYTYGYYRDSLNGSDPMGTSPNGTFYSKTNVPGQTSGSYYRAFGDTLSVQKDTSFGALRAGFWVERQSNDRNAFNVDLTLNNAPNPPNNPSKQISQLYNTTLTTIQPFFETEWNVTDRLKVIGGVKESIFIRGIDAQVNKSSKNALNFSQTYSSPLPSLMARYTISPVWSAYAQVARGFLAPQSSYFNVVDPSQSKISPQTTWNYQVGTTWQAQRLSASVDGYYIDFGNLIGSRTSGNNTVFFNQGGVNYLGVEAEATYYLGDGLSLYGNGSLNSAKNKQTGQWVPNAPKATAAGGLIYNAHNVYASLLDKWVGSSYGDVNQTQGINPYNSLDAGFSYTFRDTGLGLKNVKLTVDLNNILNSRSITQFSGYTASGDGLFYTQSGRSVFATIKVPLI